MCIVIVQCVNNIPLLTDILFNRCVEQNSQMVLLLLGKLHFQVKEITDIHHIVAPSLK